MTHIDPAYHTAQSPLSGLVVVGRGTQLELMPKPAPMDAENYPSLFEPAISVGTRVRIIDGGFHAGAKGTVTSAVIDGRVLVDLDTNYQVATAVDHLEVL